MIKCSEHPAENQFLADYSERDARWDHHRNNTQDIEAAYAANPQYLKLAERMHSCANRLIFGWSQPDLDTGETKLKLQQSLFCQARHCPVCGWRRSMRNVGRFFSALPDLRAEYPKHRWIFLTLTIKNCDLQDLKATLKTMNTAWKRLIQRQDWPATGWIRTVEVTRSTTGQAHPHFHCMLMVPPSYFSHGYVRHDQWVERWQSALRIDYSPIVDVRAIKPKEASQDLHAAAVECLKYGTKVEDGLRSAEWLYGITAQLHKNRFLATGGALAGLLSERVSNKEMISGDDAGDEDEPNEDDQAKLVFEYDRPKRKYKKSSV
jgi:plasmid rolling circle replication initiator protein Rep